MPHDPRVLLEDVRRAAELIRTFSAGRSPDDYRSDDMLKAAIERQFIVIGEALSRLERTDPSVVSRIGDYRKIIAFRNTLVHGYESVDDAIVWHVIRTGVPLLITET